ncbi:MAG TPA: hypothetical protein VKY66_07970 [Protaetiibacter sp.]|nr:hypothetical protein [Protaetiibacter sp.]
MPASDLPRARSLLGAAFRVTLRILPRMLAVSVCAIAAVALVLAATLLLARPSADAVRTAVAEGSSTATLVLLFIGGWGVVPLVAMLSGWLTTLGMAMHAADAVLRGSRLDLWRAVTSTLARLPAAAAVAVTHLLVTLSAIALGPLLWLVAVMLRLVRAVRASRETTPRISTATLSRACIPFAPAAVIAVRWALVLPEVFIGGARVRDVFRASWRRTAAGPARVAAVAVAAVMVALVVSWGLIFTAVALGNPGLELALQVVASALVAPLPPVAALVVYRALGGERSPALRDAADAGAVRRLRGGQALPAALSAVLVVTLMAPASPATAAPTPDVAFTSATAEPTTTTLDGAGPAPWGWVFGDSHAKVAGEVTTATGGAAGEVRLWARTAVGDPVVLATHVVGTDGAFSFEPTLIIPAYKRVWVEYLGSVAHAPSMSPEQAVDVHKRIIQGSLDVLTPTGNTVGGHTRLLYTPDPQRLATPGFPVAGPMTVIDPNTSGTLWTGTLHGDAPVEIVVSLARQTTIVMVNVDSPYYWLSTGEGTVVHADPAATWTTVSAQGAVVPGSQLTIYGDAASTAPFPFDGDIRFSIANDVDPTPTEVATVPTGTGGHAASTVCIATTQAPCTTSPEYLLPAGATRFQIRAEYLPSEPAILQPFSGSQSPWHTVELRDAVSGGDGGCILLSASSLVDGENGTITAPQLLTHTSCTVAGGRQGHLAGSSLTARAPTVAGYEFMHWLLDGAPVGTQATLIHTLPATTPSEPLALTAVYRQACFAIDVRVTGEARASVAPNRPCLRVDGSTGAVRGTSVLVTATGTRNSLTGEADVFIRATAGSAGLTLGRASGATTARFTIQRDIVVDVEFGPLCRAIVTGISATSSVQLTPGSSSTMTLLPELVSTPNCRTSQTEGFLRGSTAVLRADTSDPHRVITGWRVDGVLRPDLGTPAELHFPVGDAASATLEYDSVECFRVDVSRSESGRAAAGWVGAQSGVGASVEPNCPDGSGRYLAGTRVTLTGYSYASLVPGGWDQQLVEADGTPIAGSDSWGTEASRTVTVATDLAVTFHFIRANACSTITVSGGLGLKDLAFVDTGCGPGRYYDPAKENLPADGKFIGSRLNDDGSQQRYADGTPDLRPYDGPMKKAHYVHDPKFPYSFLKFSARGADIGVQGEIVMTQQAPPGAGGWVHRETEQLTCADGSCWAWVRGDVHIKVQECQALDVVVNLTVVGDETETVYSPGDMGLDDYDWVVSETPGCGDRLEWTAHRTAILRAASPAIGFEFLDWGRVDNLVGLELYTERVPGDNLAPVAVHVQIDGASPKLRVELNYDVHCGRLHLGDSIAVAAPLPTCPGAERSDPRFVIGTFVEVVAQDKNRNGRYFEGFRGAISGTRSSLQTSGTQLYGMSTASGTRWDIGTNVNYHSAFVIVDSYEKDVWGYYQHEKNAFEKAVAALPKVGKLAVGVVTLGLTAAIGLCPPCSAALAVLQATEFLVRLIPGGDVFGNVLAMLNPLNFTECAIKWGFDTLSPTSGGPISDQDATLAGLKIEAGVGTRAVKSIAIKDPTVLAKYEKYSTRLKKGAAVLTFAYGLYDNRIDQFDFSEANASELRNTDEYVNCLANTWGDPR